MLNLETTAKYLQVFFNCTESVRNVFSISDRYSYCKSLSAGQSRRWYVSLTFGAVMYWTNALPVLLIHSAIPLFFLNSMFVSSFVMNLHCADVSWVCSVLSRTIHLLRLQSVKMAFVEVLNTEIPWLWPLPHSLYNNNKPHVVIRFSFWVFYSYFIPCILFL